jgi:hypothetical protein
MKILYIMKKIIISIIFIALGLSCLMAQSANDALLFSRHYSGGTARSAGMSGAFGALGGDLSALSANPAGLAVYRGSEFTFTPGFIFTNTQAKYDGNTFKDRNTHLIINNIGYVYTKNLYNEKGLQTINFGIAYNRLSDFHSDTYVRRASATSSLLDEFTYYANGLDKFGIPLKESELHPFYEGLAYDIYAINKDGNNVYYSEYDIHGYGQPLYRSMSTRGGIGEYSFSIGFNINHQLFLGATLGIQDISFREYYYHEEKPGFEYMNDFGFSDEYSVDGSGINFKAGAIYRPIQMLRVGAAIHTPTHFWMKPYQLTRIDVNWNTIPPTDDGKDPPPYLETESDPSERYRMTTPWRYSLSAATVIGRFVMANVDVELVDYRNSSIMPKSTYNIENEDISTMLKTGVNVKGGAEFRLGPVLLRGGVAYYGNPYNKNHFDADFRENLKATMSYSGGIGFRHRDFYMDAAYLFTKHPEKNSNLYLSYNDKGSWYEQAKLQTNSGKFVFTFGFRF